MPDQLAQLSDVKAYLKIADTASDLILTRLIAATSALFLNAASRKAILTASYTETRNGNGGDRIVVRNFPVTAVASVSILGLGVPTAIPNYTGATGSIPTWGFDDYSIFLNYGFFPRGRQNVQLAYTAGYAVVPDDIQEAIITLCALRYKRKNTLDVTTEKDSVNGGVVMSFTTKDIPDFVQETIKNYTNDLPII